MNPILVKFLPELATALLVAFVAGKLAFAWHHITVVDAEKHEKTAVAAQIATDTHQCNMDKQLTENAENEYQSEISDLNRRVDANRMSSRPRKCIVPLPSALAAQRFNAAVAASPRPVATGVTSEALLDYEGACQSAVIRLIGLQNFTRQVWQANGR